MSLSNVFKNAGTRLSRFVCRNSGRVASIGHGVSTLSLIFKNVAEPSLKAGTLTLANTKDFSSVCDISAGIIFMATPFLYYKAQSDRAYWKYAGGVIVAGSLTLGAGGWTGNVLDPSFFIHALSVAPTTVAGVMMLFNKNAIGTIPELIARPFHAYAGYLQGDYGQIAVAATSIVGDVGVIASDEEIQKWILSNDVN